MELLALLARARGVVRQAARPLAIVSALVVCVSLAMRATVAGDGTEYMSMLESLVGHGTPDQRPGDVERMGEVFRRHGLAPVAEPTSGFFLATDGRSYAYHFWFYSLVCVPMKLALRAVSGDELRALAFTNAALLVGTIAWLLRARRLLPRPDPVGPGVREVFVALAVCGPVLWYVRWPHAECLGWACVVLALSAIDEGAYRRAAVIAGLGALQAPPIGVLVLLSVAVALWRTRRPAYAFSALVLGTGVASLAPAFYLVTFGVPNLIAAVGGTDPHRMTASRVGSLLFDLDQGMLGYVPFTLTLGLFALACALVRRSLVPFVAWGAALAMLALASQTTNFNAGCAGMNRYDVWTMPIMAWLAAHGLARALRGSVGSARAAGSWRRLAGATVALAVSGQLAIVASSNGDDDAHVHRPLARFLLEHAPRLYSPEPEIFAERTTETSLDPAWTGTPLPVVFFTDGDGSPATKVLSDTRSLDALLRYDTNGAWLADEQRGHAGQTGLFYLHPPAGALRRISEAPLELDGAWYGAETLGQEKWRWMGQRGSFVVRSGDGVARWLSLTGWVPEELDAAPQLTVRVDGKVVASFTPPRHRFEQRYPVYAGERVTIETTRVASPPNDTRTLGYALLDARIQAAPAPARVRFVPRSALASGQLVAATEERCFVGGARLALETVPSADASLLVGVIAEDTILRRPFAPSRIRFLVDGKKVDDEPYFGLTRRRIRVKGIERHLVDIEADAPGKLCVDALRYVFRGEEGG